MSSVCAKCYSHSTLYRLLGYRGAVNRLLPPIFTVFSVVTNNVTGAIFLRLSLQSVRKIRTTNYEADWKSRCHHIKEITNKPLLIIRISNLHRLTTEQKMANITPASNAVLASSNTMAYIQHTLESNEFVSHIL